jgi:glycine dehydrogenase subunit 1
LRYLPHTEDEIRAMLARIGAPSLDALFETIPAERRFAGTLPIEPALDEASLMRHLSELAAKNTGAEMLSFLGAGAYAHHIPPAVDQLLLRSEFYTAYTPYQPELSQGTLQAIFEFQTLVCELFGMEVANASMYDGASAAAEAALMAGRITRRTRVLASEGLHPHVIETIRGYLEGLDGAADLVLLPLDATGRTSTDALTREVDERTAAVVVGYPNFFGVVEDLRAVETAAEAKGALVVSVTLEPYALSLVEAPGLLGADIAVGEGQSLAVPPQYGGPGVGLFACKSEHLRQIPGRLCGETVDSEGKRGFVLTLSTREQHIRRERATSNICTNHGLIALSMVMRTAMLGRRGFEDAGRLCLASAEYLKARLAGLPGVSIPLAGATFNEFVVRFADETAASVLSRLEGRGILGGLDLGRFDEARENELLVAVTELHRRDDLDRLVDSIAAR